MQSIKKTLKTIATIFLVALVSLCIYTFIMTDILKKDYVNVFGYSYFVVTTGSMSGTIEVDDIIFVKITKEVKPNEVIVFKNKEGDIITHRFIQKSGSKYLTKGDVNNTMDDPITKDQIIGKVTLIISPSFILKTIAIFLIVFIFLALINFDSIIKKYIVKEKENTKVPDEIFRDKNYEEVTPSSGLTVTICLNDIENLKKEMEEEAKNTAAQEDEKFLFLKDDNQTKKDINNNNAMEIVLSILKCKRMDSYKTKMTKAWLTKYQYLYKLVHLLRNENINLFKEEITNPPFKEIYNYNLDNVGLTDVVRNMIYDLPVYSFLKLLTYCVLYNDEEMFDGIYKILKYKVAIDKEGYFNKIFKFDKHGISEINALINYMKNIAEKIDKKHVFELDKIEKMIKIANY
ncbi:MAG: S26 family signal peptidase [Bacilli bacterium]|nr:S26 family signal peptidase [Bacilli bacterium]